MKKNNRSYSQLHYEQELLAKKQRSKKDSKTFPDALRDKEENTTGILFFLRRILFPNLPNLLLNNLLFFLTCLPVFLLIELTLYTGGLIFSAGALLLAPIMVSGMSALYHRAYDYTRKIASSVRTPFMSFFIHNLRASIIPGLVYGLLWLLCGIYLLGGNTQNLVSPILYYFLVLLILFLVSCYTIMLMLQVSLFKLPVSAILKNALLLIPACGFKGILPALLQLGFILILFSNLWFGLLLFFLGIPGIITALTTYLLWPRLQQILLTAEDLR